MIFVKKNTGSSASILRRIKRLGKRASDDAKFLTFLQGRVEKGECSSEEYSKIFNRISKQHERICQ